MSSIVRYGKVLIILNQSGLIYEIKVASILSNFHIYHVSVCHESIFVRIIVRCKDKLLMTAQLIQISQLIQLKKYPLPYRAIR
jgi:hypothetical protein